MLKVPMPKQLWALESNVRPVHVDRRIRYVKLRDVLLLLLVAPRSFIRIASAARYWLDHYLRDSGLVSVKFDASQRVLRCAGGRRSMTGICRSPSRNAVTYWPL